MSEPETYATVYDAKKARDEWENLAALAAKDLDAAIVRVRQARDELRHALANLSRKRESAEEKWTAFDNARASCERTIAASAQTFRGEIVARADEAAKEPST